MHRPRLILCYALFNLYVIADVLLTGGATSTALAAWLCLIIWMAQPWFQGASQRREDHQRAHP